MAILVIAMLSTSLASCGSDDDNNEDGSFLVGEWYECDSKGVFRNEATEEEVYHLRLRANGTGDFWSVSKGKEDAYKYSFEYSIEDEVLHLAKNNFADGECYVFIKNNE